MASAAVNTSISARIARRACERRVVLEGWCERPDLGDTFDVNSSEGEVLRISSIDSDPEAGFDFYVLTVRGVLLRQVRVSGVRDAHDLCMMALALWDAA